MTAPLQSDAKAFIRSLGGARDGQDSPEPPVIFGSSTIWRVVDKPCFPGGSSGWQDCAGDPFSFAGEESRVRFDDSQIDLRDISNISQSNPAVVTTVSPHLLTNDMAIRVTGQTGMPELTTDNVNINVTGANTFEMLGEDSTGYSPYVSGGNVIVKDISFFGNFRFTGLASNDVYVMYMRCLPNDGVTASEVDDAGGSHVGQNISADFGINGYRIHFPGLASCSDSPFQSNEELRVDQIYTPLAFIPEPNANYQNWPVAYIETVVLQFSNGPADPTLWQIIEPAGAVFQSAPQAESVTVEYQFDLDDVGTTTTFTVQAENPIGTLQESWDVTLSFDPGAQVPVFNPTDNDIAVVTTTYIKNISLSQGTTPIDWEILAGPSTGTYQLSGSTGTSVQLQWTGFINEGTVNWTIRAANRGGFETSSWETQVFG